VVFTDVGFEIAECAAEIFHRSVIGEQKPDQGFDLHVRWLCSGSRPLGHDRLTS